LWIFTQGDGKARLARFALPWAITSCPFRAESIFLDSEFVSVRAMPQRSSINFWLLLAVTICVDAVSMSLIYGGAQERAEALYVALVCGQLSALCAWSSFSKRPLARSMVAFGFAIAASLWAGMADLISRKSLEQTATAYAGLWLSHVALLLILLWTVKRTAHGRHLGQSAGNVSWQFSTMHLFVMMTTLSVLIVLLRTSEIIQDVWLWVIIVIVNDVTVAIVCILILDARWHVIARCAVAAGIAALLGSILYLIRGWPEIIAVNLIHAFVLLAWLEVGGIMPKRNGAIA
jgi:hypothetical protein